MKIQIISLLLCVGLSIPEGFSQSNFIPPASDALIQQLTYLDSSLFAASFDNCDLNILDELLADDMEFYHDKWGKTASTAEQFKKGIRSNCADQEAGKSPKAKRELVPGSMKIYPMNQYGALQMGKHDFYQFKEGEFVFTESALFTHLWQKTEDGWKLTRVLSYDHKPER